MTPLTLTPEEREECLQEMAGKFPQYREQLRMEFVKEATK